MLLCRALPAQTDQQPFDLKPGPSTFTQVAVSYEYPETWSSIHDIDFRNFSYRTFDPESGHPHWSFTLRNGGHKYDDRDSHSSVILNSVFFLKSANAQSDDTALVLMNWSAEGEEETDGELAEVFTLKDRHLHLVQQMGWDSKFPKGDARDAFDPAGTFMAVSAHYLPGDARCCVSALDLVILKWDGAKFVRSSTQTKLTETGQGAGKKLPL